MRDVLGDRIIVRGLEESVFLTVTDSHQIDEALVAHAELSPKKARKLAGLLLTAATEIEAQS